MRLLIFLLRPFANTLLVPLRLWLLKSDVVGGYAGIQFSDLTIERQRSAEFAAFTTEALQLIEQTSPRHFHLVRRELRYIANESMTPSASFHRSIRTCKMNFQRFQCAADEPVHEWYLASYASAIVHEATHGRVHRFGIPYNDHTWERIERLCRREQRRFANRLRGEYYDFATLVPEFDPTWYQAHRALSRFQAMRKRMARSRTIEAESSTKESFFAKSDSS